MSDTQLDQWLESFLISLETFEPDIFAGRDWSVDEFIYLSGKIPLTLASAYLQYFGVTLTDQFLERSETAGAVILATAYMLAHPRSDPSQFKLPNQDAYRASVTLHASLRARLHKQEEKAAKTVPVTPQTLSWLTVLPITS